MESVQLYFTVRVEPISTSTVMCTSLITPSSFSTFVLVTFTAALQSLQANKQKGKMLVPSLHVRTTNHAALALYEKFGFRKDGLIKDYYECKTERGDQDAWRMLLLDC